jgi:hypothetical protein
MDKPHTEAFTFSLLVIALTLMRTAPWWSMVAAGAAATQNPPMAVILVSVFAAHLLANRQIVYDRRFLAGAAGGLALAALQPLYTYLRHGSLSLLILANPARRPTLVEILAVPLDPDIGLLANFPVFALVCLVAVGVVLSKRPRALLSAETVIAGTAGVVFLASFAQTNNLHHGATPSMSRYAIWLVPLAIPFIRQADVLAGTLWKKFLTGAAVVSAAVCAFAFNPDVVANAHEPTLAADFLWTRHPGWNNPLPEIFVETMNEREYHLLPVTTMGCEKLLLMGNPEGMWPIPCLPGNPPNWCRTPGALCYANRATDHYQFARPAGPPIRHEGFAPQPEQTWPAAAEPHVRTLFTEWDWWHLKPRTAGDDLFRLRHDVRVWVLEAPAGSCSAREVGGIRRHQLPAMTGLLVMTSGQTLRKVEFNGAPIERWDVNLDPGLDVLLLPLWPK